MSISRIRITSLALLFVLVSLNVHGQNRPVGYWRSLLPYNVGVGLCTDGNTIYTLCGTQTSPVTRNLAFFSLKGTSQNAQAATYSKAEGMSDMGLQCAAYDAATSTTVLVYTDGNIDLFKESQNTFYNVPDFKLKSISATKAVNMVYTEAGVAYLSTSVGVLVLDLTTHNFSETYQFLLGNQVLAVQGFVGSGSYYYAITHSGLYRAPKNSPQLQNFQIWELVDTNGSYTAIAGVDNKVYLSTTKYVNVLDSGTIKTVYVCRDSNNASIQHIDPCTNGVLISSFYSSVFRGSVIRLNSSYQVADSIVAGDPLQAVQLSDGSIWFADVYYGLGRSNNSGGAQYYVPQGPSSPYCYDIYANNKDVWIAHGGYNQDLFAQPSGEGISHFDNEKWTNYKGGKYAPFDTVDDFAAVVKDERNGTVYMGSYLQGLFTLHANGSYSILNAGSIFDTSVAVFGQNQRQIIGLMLDTSENLWVTLAFSHDQLYVKTPDSNWHKFFIPGDIGGGPMVMDDYGQVWFVSSIGNGVGVLNYNGTLNDPSDDVMYHLTTGAGNGNLPSNAAHCIAKDKNNSIWIGTDNGIGIISNCSLSASGSPCDAQWPIVQYDQFAGYLFAGNAVRAIAVDGANRKWVGTDAGVWLLSPNANKIIYRFTTDNSPLPSNVVKKITIDNVTGDVYIGTDQGLMSFHGTATEGDVSNHNEEIFPNPVPSGYAGTIAIKGLAANADVRITDIDGQLVYKTTALGGQAVWNGIDYKGHRPQSGVYLVFVSSTDGTQTYTGKIVFVQ